LARDFQSTSKAIVLRLGTFAGLLFTILTGTSFFPSNI
jgi:hypothetical protein